MYAFRRVKWPGETLGRAYLHLIMTQNSRRNRLKKRMHAGARVERTNLSWVTPLSSPDQSYKNSIEYTKKTCIMI